jgi:hypothetical protein
LEAGLNVGIRPSYPYFILDIDRPDLLRECLTSDAMLSIMPETYRWSSSKQNDLQRGAVIMKMKQPFPFVGSKINLKYNAVPVGEIKLQPDGYQLCPPSETILEGSKNVHLYMDREMIGDGEGNPGTNSEIGEIDFEAMLAILEDYGLYQSPTRKLDRAVEGERNSKLFQNACDLRDDDIPFEKALESLTIAGRCKGLSDREIRTTVKSAYKRSKNYRETATPYREGEPLTWDNIYVFTSKGDIKGLNHNLLGKILAKDYIFLRSCNNQQDRGLCRVNGKGYVWVDSGSEKSKVQDLIKENAPAVVEKHWTTKTWPELWESINLHAVRMCEYQPQKGKLPLKNGVLDVNTEKLLEYPGPCLVELPIEYDPEARCDNIVAWLDSTFLPNQKELFLSLLGAVLSLQPAPYVASFTGAGRNGKGIARELVKMVLGNTYTSADLMELNRQFSNSIFIGKILIWQDEVPDTKQNQTLIKKVTGGTELTINQKYVQGAYHIPLQAAVFMDSNSPPEQSSGLAIESRFRVFDMPYSFVPDPKPNTRERPLDRFISSKFSEEVSGFLNLLLPYIKHYCNFGELKYDEPVDMVAYSQKTDSLNGFLDEYCMDGESSIDLIKAFYELYCERNNIAGDRRWRHKLEEKRIITVHPGGIVLGLAIKPELLAMYEQKRIPSRHGIKLIPKTLESFKGKA